MQNYTNDQKNTFTFSLPQLFLCLISCLSLAGCHSSETTFSPSQPNTLHGIVLEGSQPIAGSSLNLYEATNSAPIILGKTSSESNGKFILNYQSPALGSEVYVVASGGEIKGIQNMNINLVNVLGQSTLLPGFATLNEITTIASYQAFSRHWDTDTRIPVLTEPSDPFSLNIAFSTYEKLINLNEGTLSEANPGTSLAGEQLAVQANVLALCIQNVNNCTILKGYINAEHHTPIQNSADTFSLAAALKAAGDYSSQYIHALPQINALLLANVTALPYPNTTTLIEGSLALMYHSTISLPQGVTHDLEGNIWVANPSNFVTELKKNANGTYTFQDFSALRYHFDNPSAITSDKNGNIWVTNSLGKSVTEIKNDGDYTPVLFSGSAYQFSSPIGITSDPEGNIWVTNVLGDSVTEIKNDANNTPAVFAGTPYNFSGPTTITSDNEGNIWVANNGPNHLIELNRAANYTPVSFDISTQVYKLTSDNNDNIWITNGQYAVTELEKNKGYSATVFSGYPQYGFYSTCDISSDEDGNIWIANANGNSITELLNDGHYTPRIFSDSSYAFNIPIALSIDQEGNIWVVNQDGKNITEMKKSANFTPSVFSGNNYNFAGIQSVASDQEGNIFVANPAAKNQNSGEELEISGSHQPLLFAGGKYQQHTMPFSIITDPAGNVWGTDPFGNIVTALKAFDLTHPITFSGRSYGLNSPFAFTSDPLGNIWLLNANNTVVELIKNNNYQPLTFAADQYGFNNPSAIISDKQGNIWVANTGARSLLELKLTSNGYLPVTFSGLTYFTDNPIALTSDPDGDIWVLNYQEDDVIELINKGDHYVPFKYQGTGFSFYFPSAIMSDNAGNIWLINFGKGVSQLKKISPSQYAGKLFLSLQYGLENPNSITSDGNGNIWIANSNNNLIEMISP